MNLFVIAGHGAGDPGAVGYGYNEAERVRALTNKLIELGGSQVTCYDQDRDCYQDNGLSSLNIPDGTQVIELHMDSASASARGGHVIIKAGFNPDQYDTGLANFIGTMFPGRSTLISQRSDLQNVNVAASRGIPYRLLECCFISNEADLSKFNSNMEELARGILNVFGIANEQPKPEPSHTVQIWEQNSTNAQKWWMRDNGDGTVSLRNASSYTWLSVPNSAYQDGTPVQVWDGISNGTQDDDPKDCQKFKIVGTEREGVKTIVPAFRESLALDVPWGSTQPGTALQWYSRNGTYAQQWFFYRLDDGAYRIVNCGSWKLLDVVNGGV